MTQQTDRLNTALAGRYRIERQLGEGGMATVYLCEDIKHKRKVALKLLKPELAAVLGAERFVQEITTTAALQHPHILPLFDSGTADGFLFYVMPYIQGETLREKLNRETQLGVDEAVRITRDVADALDYAHRHGVIHRDIKPENILLHDGRPMVADFGIALAVSAAAGGRMTETGLSLGTPHYMSPEQATAEKEITARSDIYAIGSVLYEMLTGNPPFVGAVAQQIIMKIITTPAEPVTVHRKSVPANVAAAVAKSLEKLPADRFESAKAFAEALGNPAYANSSGAGATRYTAAGDSPRWPRPREAAAWALAAAGIAAATYLVTRHEPVPVAARLIAELPDSVRAAQTPFTHVAISRDGRRLAFVGEKGGTQMVYVRGLDDPGLAAVRGSEGAASVALSPDGDWFAFSVRNRGIFKLPILGGIPQLVSDSAGGNSPTWGESGDIVFRNVGGALLLAPADGSKPRRLVALDSAGLFDTPSLLPGGRDVLVSRGIGGGDRGLVLVSIADGHVTDLKMAGFGGSYSAGSVVFSRPLGMVFSAPFSLSKRAFTGPATLLLQGVGVLNLSQAATEIAVAGNGTLVYVSGGATDARSLVTVDRQGVEQPLSREDRLYGEPRVSPDGRHIVMRIGESADLGDVWIYDVGVGSLTSLTADKKSLRPEWSRDGARIITTDQVSADSILVQSRPWDRNGGVQTLLRAVTIDRGGVGTASIGPPHGWSAFRVKNNVVGDILIAPTDSLQALRPFLASPAAENMPRVSPNGRLLAYSSSKSGHNEVYLQPIPGPGPEVAVSTGWGQEPVWSSDGASLFYRSLSRMMVATITERPAPAVTRRDSLFVDRWDRSAFNGAYDLFPDGKRFVMTRPAKAGSGKAPGLFVVMNWPQLAARQGGATDGR